LNRQFTEAQYYVYEYIRFSEQKFGDKENKSKNAADAEKFVDNDIIPSPGCNGQYTLLEGQGSWFDSQQWQRLSP